jgi:hypothetical protein
MPVGADVPTGGTVSNADELAGGVADALLALEGKAGSFTNRALAGDLLWWLGSGISRDVVPGTGEFMIAALERMQEFFLETDDTAFRDGFESILARACRTNITIDMAPADWPARDALCDFLRCNYATVLESLLQYTRGKVDLVREVLRIPEQYGANGLQPDAEHRLLAALIAEGLVSEIVTTNWDPLVEVAYDESAPGSPMDVVAHPDDLSAVRPRVLKIHGCAARSLADGDKFSGYLVATAEQIDSWAVRAHQFRDAVLTALRERPVVFVGCSAQDNDIKLAVMLANERRDPFPADVPRATFVTDEMTADFETVLSRLHGESFAGQDAERLKADATIPLRAKEMLAALWWTCVSSKARVLLGLANPPLDKAWTECLDRAVDRTVASLDARYATEAPMNRWRLFAADMLPTFSRVTAMYKSGEVPRDPRIYVPATGCSVSATGTDAGIKQSGLHLPLMGLLGLMEHVAEKDWGYRVPNGAPESEGQFVLDVGGVECRVFILDHSFHSFTELLDRDDFDEQTLGDALFLFGRGPSGDRVREDVYRSRLPDRSRAETPAILSVDDEIVIPGLSFDQSLELMRERIPLGSTQ